MIMSNDVLHFGQTQPIKVYSPRKLIFNVYSPPTFLVILQYIRLALFGHLNNPQEIFPCTFRVKMKTKSHLSDFTFL